MNIVINKNGALYWEKLCTNIFRNFPFWLHLYLTWFVLPCHRPDLLMPQTFGMKTNLSTELRYSSIYIFSVLVRVPLNVIVLKSGWFTTQLKYVKKSEANTFYQLKATMHRVKNKPHV